MSHVRARVFRAGFRWNGDGHEAHGQKNADPWLPGMSFAPRKDPTHFLLRIQDLSVSILRPTAPPA